MFDKLDDLIMRYEDIMNELNEPGVANDQERFRKLMKEQSDLTPIIDTYKEYKKSLTPDEINQKTLKIDTSGWF